MSVAGSEMHIMLSPGPRLLSTPAIVFDVLRLIGLVALTAAIRLAISAAVAAPRAICHRRA